ncbi:uncharacterized protein N7459_003426 [Penicillium hispanicum]|uniref:uncharacterized protein n=1 Tax=Penicillium hispanicum TaxID=1080232 RepID=UPI002540D15C|nr:uncharacterized protein N7459_003426 [Penicillium hispanicum]KAJ5587661.1 hypothetical protein N7459_003426 [Penicillium hispanicum]
MRFLTLSANQAALLLPFFLSLPLHVLSLPFDGPFADLARRGDDDDDCDDGEGLGMTPILDGPTSNKAAGMGVEFESAGLRFNSAKCSIPDTNSAKGAVIGGRKGTNWELTGDVLAAGVLSAEYILDGQTILLGTDDAVNAAKAVVNDITSWNPSAEMTDNTVDVADSPCNPWTITEPSEGKDIKDVTWAPQITVAMPLKAINYIFTQRTASNLPLLPKIARANQNMVTVTSEFFQASPNGISASSVGDDVLGFFSLVLTYAKAADKMDNESPKYLSSIMPRTDFTTMFSLVKSKVPGTLYDLVNTLACYKNNGDSVELDTEFCSGTAASPTPNGKMDKQTFYLEYNDKEDSCTVKEWMESIQDSKSPDRLSEVDQVLNGQVGGLKKKLENLVGTTISAPLLEFRRLPSVTVSGMESMVSSAEAAVVSLQKTYK